MSVHLESYSALWRNFDSIWSWTLCQASFFIGLLIKNTSAQVLWAEKLNSRLSFHLSIQSQSNVLTWITWIYLKISTQFFTNFKIAFLRTKFSWPFFYKFLYWISILLYCHIVIHFFQLVFKQNHFIYKLLNQITFCIHCHITLLHSQGPTADLRIQNYHATNGGVKWH